MEWLPAGRGYGWLREWALSGVMYASSLWTLQHLCFGPDVAADYSDRGENRDPGRRQEKSLTKEKRLENGPLLARLFGQYSDQIACVHMSGLFSRSHMNAGQDGFRDASSKHPSDLWRPVESTECLASWIDRSHHLLVALQVLASAQHGCS